MCHLDQFTQMVSARWDTFSPFVSGSQFCTTLFSCACMADKDELVYNTPRLLTVALTTSVGVDLWVAFRTFFSKLHFQME